MGKVNITKDPDKQEMLDGYTDAVNRLTQIVTANKPGTFTQVEIGLMFDAIQDIARILRFILRNLAKQYF